MVIAEERLALRRQVDTIDTHVRLLSILTLCVCELLPLLSGLVYLHLPGLNCQVAFPPPFSL